MNIARVASQVPGLNEALLTLFESAWAPATRKAAIGRVIEKLLAHLGAEECLVYLARNGGRDLERAYGTENIANLDLFDHQENLALVSTALHRGEPVILNAIEREVRVPFSEEAFAIGSLLCLPLALRGEKIGAIEILNKLGGEFGSEDVAFIEGISRPLAVALESHRMFDGAEKLAITDDLTQLYNYRYLTQYLATEAKRCLRYKKKVSLLFIDVDGFKRINDTFGHLTGSEALAEIARMLRGTVRETDVVGRYGGDEFVIVLPETPLNGALIIAERIRKRVEDYEFHAQDQNVHLTVSLGVANLPKHTLTAEGLIKKADAAMYRAKGLSKNTIRVAV